MPKPRLVVRLYVKRYPSISWAFTWTLKLCLQSRGAPPTYPHVKTARVTNHWPYRSKRTALAAARRWAKRIGRTIVEESVNV